MYDESKSEGGKDDFKCRKIDNNKISNDITKPTYIDLPRNWSDDCVDKLVQIGLAEILADDGVEKNSSTTTISLLQKDIYPQQ